MPGRVPYGHLKGFLIFFQVIMNEEIPPVTLWAAEGKLKRKK